MDPVPRRSLRGLSFREGLPVTDDILEVRDLVKHFPVKSTGLPDFLGGHRVVVHAVDGISFSLRRGEIFGLVGESGCGKTTAGRTVLRLLEPTAGTIRFDGMDITHLKEAKLRPLRKRMQIIFQDPHAALNPAMTIGQSIADPLIIHEGASETEAKASALDIMNEVGLAPAEQLFAKYPGDLSGGQKQRAVIARAMILKPELIVADEPVAMLDMSIRSRVLEVILDLKRRYGHTYLFITHDLATAKFICDRIGIMYLGRIVEIGAAKNIYADPKHPYTKALLEAIPVPDPMRRGRKVLPQGEVPDAVYPPAGCRFHPRCPAVLPTCGWEGRDFVEFLEQRWISPEVAAAESALGPVEHWEVSGLVARRPGRADDPGNLADKIRVILAEVKSPMTEAIDVVDIDRNDVVIRFRPPAKLEPVRIEGRIVECLLY
jgi:oligopeptide/dipeptide ABC transporter ATP-binding protein